MTKILTPFDFSFLEMAKSEIKEAYKNAKFDRCLYLSDRMPLKVEDLGGGEVLDEYLEFAEKYKSLSIEGINQSTEKGEFIICPYFYENYINKNRKFTDDEIEFIKSIGFDEFDGENVNISHPLTGDNIAMATLGIYSNSIFEQINPNSTCINIIYKLILNYDFDVNSINDELSSLLGNLILLQETVIIKLLLSARGDLNFKYHDSEYGETYLELAEGIGNEAIVEMLEIKEAFYISNFGKTENSMTKIEEKADGDEEDEEERNEENIEDEDKEEENEDYEDTENNQKQEIHQRKKESIDSDPYKPFLVIIIILLIIIIFMILLSL